MTRQYLRLLILVAVLFGCSADYNPKWITVSEVKRTRNTVVTQETVMDCSGWRQLWDTGEYRKIDNGTIFVLTVTNSLDNLGAQFQAIEGDAP